MDNKTHLLFKNKSGIFEEQITTPFASLSIADILVILISGMLSFIIWNVVTGGSLDFGFLDVAISLAPVIFGLFLVVKSFGIDPLYVTLFLILTLKKEKKKYKKSIKNKKNSSSKILGYAENYKFSIDPKKEVIQEIICEELDRHIRLKTTLTNNDGNIYANKTIKVYINGMKGDTIRTSSEGELVVDFTPDTVGRKEITFKTEDGKIIYTKFVDIKEKVLLT